MNTYYIAKNIVYFYNIKIFFINQNCGILYMFILPILHTYILLQFRSNKQVKLF